MMVSGGQNPVLWLVDFLARRVCLCVFKEPCKLMCCKPLCRNAETGKTYLLAMMNMSSPASCDKYRYTTVSNILYSAKCGVWKLSVYISRLL
jgi:hypothetical protein